MTPRTRLSFFLDDPGVPMEAYRDYFRGTVRVAAKRDCVGTSRTGSWEAMNKGRRER